MLLMDHQPVQHALLRAAHYGRGYALYNKLVKASFMDFIMLCTINYLFKLDQPRIFNALIPILTLMLTIIERWLARRFLHRHRREGKGFGYPTIIIGSPESIHDTIVQLRNSKSLDTSPSRSALSRRAQATRQTHQDGSSRSPSPQTTATRPN